MELTSLGTVCVILVFFQLFPVPPKPGESGSLDAARILQGFANPALVAVLALLVLGQGVDFFIKYIAINDLLYFASM